MLQNLLKLSESVSKDMVEGDAFNIDYVDFLKGFDKVPHQSLLKRRKVFVWIDKWIKTENSG